ncbi:thioredoxin [Erwinia phage FBB1]|nr:thioredoxin [Erwinia phage FBB1]
MSTVTITKGTYRGNEVKGTFEMVKTWLPGRENLNEVEAALGDGKVFVIIDGKERGVWVFNEDIKMEGKERKVEVVKSVDEIKEEIRKRFNVMGLMTKGIIGGNVRSLIISGAAGIGKTYSLDKALQKSNDRGEIEYNMVNGKISGIGLYCKLYENRGPNSVLLIDDVDVYSDMDILNLLKAALDSGEKRQVCWSTASSFLEEKKIPNAFEFEGTVVFITNVDIDRELERGSKLSPHINALVSRSVYLDLCVHTNEQIMIRVEDVVMTTDMLQKRGLANSEVIEVIDFMKANVARLRNVSLRTALYIADFVVTDRKNWKEIAEVTMLK